MKIPYGLSATGNGHVSRAQAIIPELSKYAEVDILSSGPGYGLELKHPVKYKKEGFTFVFDEKGKIRPLKTIFGNSIKNYIKDLATLDLTEYDLVLTDFEPITAWKARLKGIPCIGFGHQYAYFSKEFRDKVDVGILHALTTYFASGGKNLAINYEKTEDWFFTPILRDEVRKLKPTNGKHITVYLVGYEKEYILEKLLEVPEVQWHFFNESITKDEIIKNVHLRKVDKKTFSESIGSCAGIISGGGFSATAEALYLGKKLMVIPLSNHFEQQHNAEMLQQMGVTKVDVIDENFSEQIREWIKNGKTVKKEYTDVVPEIVQGIIEYAKEKKVN